MTPSEKKFCSDNVLKTSQLYGNDNVRCTATNKLGKDINIPCKMTPQEMTNGEMIETLKKIMVDYNCGYKVLTKDGSYAYPFKNEIDALTHSIGLLEREEQK